MMAKLAGPLMGIKDTGQVRNHLVENCDLLL